MATRIQLLHDNESTWTTDNLTLLNGEVAVVHDSANNLHKVKVGDGVTPFNGLNFIGDHLKYRMVEPMMTTTTTDGVSYKTYQMTNLAMNKIVIENESDKVKIVAPVQTQDGTSRCYMVRIEVKTASSPTVAFTCADDSVETIDYECDQENWAVLEPGVNLFQFTETARNQEDW